MRSKQRVLHRIVDIEQNSVLTTIIAIRQHILAFFLCPSLSLSPPSSIFKFLNRSSLSVLCLLCDPFLFSFFYFIFCFFYSFSFSRDVSQVNRLFLLSIHKSLPPSLPLLQCDIGIYALCFLFRLGTLL